MKPITNLLLLVALACYVFLPLFEISLVGNITGLQFTASMISAQQGAQYTAFVLIPFITIFLAIGFNSLKNRYWGIVVALLIFVTLYFFANVASMFQGFSLSDDPSVTSADVEMAEGMPVAGLGSGFYVSLVLTVLALLSALVSLMPFKFNKRLEESLDKRFVESKRHISKVGHKVGHEIHDEWNKIGGKHNRSDKMAQNKPEVQQQPEQPEQPQPAVDPEDDTRFMPKQASEDDRYSDYMPKG